MILGVVGSRNFDSYSLLEKEIKNLLYYKQITEIVSGGARGADSLAKLFALSNTLKLKEFIPSWRPKGIYNPKAGFERNTLIVNYADIIIAFWDKESPGTKDSITKAKKLKKPCYIVYF